MLKKYLLSLIFLLSRFDNILSESYCAMENRDSIDNIYYVKVSGTNIDSCTSSTADLCGSFEHVMVDLPFPKIVYIQPGDYQFTTSQTIESPTDSFEINGVTDSVVDIEDISAYPAITFSLQYSFSSSITFYSLGYFHCLKILWGIPLNTFGRCFSSFFFFFFLKKNLFILFILFLILILIFLFLFIF
jgi:hypothetical protein